MMGGSVINTNLFSLRHTFESGQPLTFFADYNRSRNAISYQEGNSMFDIKMVGSAEKGRLVLNAGKADGVRRRFRLDDDMQGIYGRINTDPFMDRAIRRYSGMRLTVNDPWETTLVFIISQLNNLKRIRLITRNIIERFGTPIKDEDGRVVARSFPTSEDLMEATEKELRECNAGFRDKYIRSAAEYCTNNLDLYRLRGKSYHALKEELMTISGVGDKVADCIALMGYGRLEAFPIDVWVKRTLERIYFKGRKRPVKQLHRFVDERFGDMKGYAQQYIFWGGRMMA
ncbi:MAG: DNA-3-methyladenine glycosylase 2 family protein [Candidatus Micrarchaeota archaeon]|nr:DNA-3-methyladenine glycosylase 2 family protein [Candidatus Micrarchaeota archaeon]